MLSSPYNDTSYLQLYTLGTNQQIQNDLLGTNLGIQRDQSQHWLNFFLMHHLAFKVGSYWIIISWSYLGFDQYMNDIDTAGFM